VPVPVVEPVAPIQVKIGPETRTPDSIIVPVFLYWMRQIELPSFHQSNKEAVKRDIAQAMNTTVAVAALVLLVVLAAFAFALA
jgi:uncharacterized Tic20 family protein